MMRPRRRFSRSSGGRRRKLVWARASNTPAGTAIAVGTVIGTNLLSDYETQAGGDPLNGATLMAIRGRFWATNDAGATATSIGWGIRLDDAVVVSQAAAVLLATRGPMTTGRYQDWLARDYHWQPSTAAPASLFVGSAVNYDALAIRSRRKLNELNSTIALYVENPAGSVASLYAFNIDLLLALP